MKVSAWLKRNTILACLIIGTAGGMGCGGGGGSDDPDLVSEAARAVNNICVLGDQCNRLGGGVQECVDVRVNCLESLTSDDQRDWAHYVNQCLEFADCDRAVDCYLALPLNCVN